MSVEAGGSETLSREALERWLAGRRPHWQRLEDELNRQRDNRKQDPQAVQALVEEFRGLARDVALARVVLPDARLTRQLEALLARAHEAVYKPPRRPLAALARDLRRQVPAILWQLRGALAAVLALFGLGALASALLVNHYPEMISLFASPEMVHGVQQGELWTDDLLNIIPSSVLSLSLMTNNILVALTAYALGALYGLGTVYIMVLNGALLGAVFAFTAQYDLAGRLGTFVVAHGVVELSIIFLAGAAGVSLGEALVRPGARSRGAAFRHAVAQAGRLLVVAVPFLVLAGLIEGYISPDPDIGLAARIAVGLVSGALFWWVLLGLPMGRKVRP